jgi:hypothetical protein
MGISEGPEVPAVSVGSVWPVDVIFGYVDLSFNSEGDEREEEGLSWHHHELVATWNQDFSITI